MIRLSNFRHRRRFWSAGKAVEITVYAVFGADDRLAIDNP
jgi:hypothetical protein